MNLEMDTGIVKLFLFSIVTICLLYFSQASLRVVRSHGFYRFFAWEAITALILVNIGLWFSHPFSFSPNHFVDVFNLVFSVSGKRSTYDSVIGETQHTATGQHSARI